MSKLQWFQNLTGGLNQAVDSNLTENNQSPFSKNITLSKVGNWMTRKGTSLFCNRVNTSDEVWGVFNYDSYSTTTGITTHQIGMVTDRDLRFSNAGETTFGASVDDDEWTANSKVRGINFLNRIYLGCDDFTTPVAWSVGGAITDIVSGLPGGYLATNRNMMAIGGNAYAKNIIFHTDPYTDKVFESTFTADNASTGSTLTGPASTFRADVTGSYVYNATDKVMARIIAWISPGASVTLDLAINDTWDGDTIYILSNLKRHEAPVTAVIGYNEGFVSFDEDTMHVWDPISTISTKLPGIGCVNHDTLKALAGNLIWVNRSGVFLWSGDGRPTDISVFLKDSQNGFGIWDLLTTANFTTMSAGIDETKGIYYLSIGDLQTVTDAPASACTNVVLTFDINKGEWEFHVFNREPYCFTNFISADGSKGLYFGEKDAAAVYKLDVGLTDAVGDGTTATIPFEIRTKSHVLGQQTASSTSASYVGNQTVARRIRSYFIRYVSTNDATLSTSVNEGAFVEQDILVASPIIKTLEVKPTKVMEGILHSLKIVGTGKFILKGYGFKYDDLTTTRLPNS